jgi:hypothetical protein
MKRPVGNGVSDNVRMTAHGCDMNIGLFKGSVLFADGSESLVWWAEASTGVWTFLDGSEEVTHATQAPEARFVERVTVLELPEIDEQSAEDIVVSLLKGRYLDKPGVRDSGEAALYMLVNEAIHKLSRIMQDERTSGH